MPQGRKLVSCKSETIEMAATSHISTFLWGDNSIVSPACDTQFNNHKLLSFHHLVCVRLQHNHTYSSLNRLIARKYQFWSTPYVLSYSCGMVLSSKKSVTLILTSIKSSRVIRPNFGPSGSLNRAQRDHSELDATSRTSKLGRSRLAPSCPHARIHDRFVVIIQINGLCLQSMNWERPGLNFENSFIADMKYCSLNLLLTLAINNSQHSAMPELLFTAFPEQAMILKLVFCRPNTTNTTDPS